MRRGKKNFPSTYCPSFPTISEEDIYTRAYNYHCLQHTDISNDDRDAREFMFLTDNLEQARRKMDEERDRQKAKRGGRK